VGRLKPCPDTCLVQKFLGTRHAASLRRNRMRRRRFGSKSNSKQAIRFEIAFDAGDPAESRDPRLHSGWKTSRTAEGGCATQVS
jgi:hypothetical protein